MAPKECLFLFATYCLLLRGLVGNGREATVAKVSDTGSEIVGSMFGYELSTLGTIVCWSIANVCVGIICGFLLGRGYTLFREPRKLKRDREEILAALKSMMASSDQLNDDVGVHNSELQSVQQEVILSAPDTQMTEIKEALLSNISKVISSNRRLEHDLVQTRYQMEQQAQELDRTRKEARSDGLCSVGNRKAFDETVQFMISRYQTKRKPFGLILIDIDHFKRINDTFGHSAGDRVLTSIGGALNSSVRPDDCVCRIGGDEFAIILPGLSGENASVAGKRIHSKLELVDFSVGNNIESTVVTFSMGLTVVKAADTPLSICERADRALYRSKELGRNRLSIIVDDEVVTENSAIVNALPGSISMAEISPTEV